MFVIKYKKQEQSNERLDWWERKTRSYIFVFHCLCSCFRLNEKSDKIPSFFSSFHNIYIYIVLLLCFFLFIRFIKLLPSPLNMLTYMSSLFSFSFHELFRIARVAYDDDITTDVSRLVFHSLRRQSWKQRMNVDNKSTIWREEEIDRGEEEKNREREKLLGFIDARLRSILINNCCLVHYFLSFFFSEHPRTIITIIIEKISRVSFSLLLFLLTKQQIGSESKRKRMSREIVYTINRTIK